MEDLKLLIAIRGACVLLSIGFLIYKFSIGTLLEDEFSIIWGFFGGIYGVLLVKAIRAYRLDRKHQKVVDRLFERVED